MLNIFNIKLNINNNDVLNNRCLTKSKQIKHISPATKEWNNSIYAYNKNTLNIIPVTNKLIIKLIQSYFNMYSRKLESKMKRQLLRIKLRRLSSHKIYVSKGEFKHTNNKITINIYIYNKQKQNYIYKIKKLFELIKKISLKRKIQIIRKKALLLLEKTVVNNNLTKKDNNIKIKYIYYNKLFLRNFLKRSLKRQMLYIYYMRLLLLNKLKFRSTFLNKIINLIKKIYNKNIEFNIINVKYFYLNSDIYTESIVNKIIKNRKKLYRILNSSVKKVKIANKKLISKYRNINTFKKLNILNYIETNNIKSYLSKRNKKDCIDILLKKIFKKYIIKNNTTLKKTVINSIKNKTITGVRLETAGRLSKRHTASRSLFKLRHKGSLKNIDSSYNKLSSQMIRGNIKSNLQYTNINSVVAIGSFGIKGWISNNY
jgi:hypothetical protein